MANNEFEDSCSPLPLPCPQNSPNEPDPCDCHVYYVCDNGNYKSFECAPGTFFDHVRKQCFDERDPEYEDYGCGGTQPWLRCQDVGGHYGMDVLGQLCDPNYPGGGGGGGTPGDNAGSGSGGNDTGAIVGGVVGGLVLAAVIAVIVIVFLKRRGKGDVLGPRSHNYQVNVISGNHTTGQEEEQVYDVIDEKQMTSLHRIQRVDHSYANEGYQGDGDASIGGDYSLAKEIPRNSHLTVPKQSDGDDLSRSVSINGREIPVEDCEGYQIAYPIGSMPRIPSQHAVEPSEDAPPPPSGYFELEKENEYE